MKMYELQELLENKNACMKILDGAGVRTPKLHYSGAREGFSSSSVPAFPVVLKKVRSAGGMGVTICDTKEKMDRALGKMDGTEEIQVQEMVSGIDTSKQYFLTDDGWAPITNTDQIIKNKVEHAGNQILSAQMDASDNQNADRAAQKLWSMGYRGYFAVDMMKPSDGGPARVIEVNCRAGGVTAPTSVATQLGFSRFVNRQFKFKDEAALLNTLESLGFKEGDREGVVPLLVIPLDDGTIKTELLCLSEAGGLDMAERAEKSAGAYARDGSILFIGPLILMPPGRRQ